MSILVNIEDLLSGEIVEGTRMEFKKGWNPDPIMRSICAFANDFENEGSGYIIIGVDEKDGTPIRPVEGFNPEAMEKIEKEIIRYCNLIKPSYYPRLSLEEIDNKHVLVIWVPGGSNRPYKVPDSVIAKHKTYNYRIRYRSNSIVPNNEQEAELIQLTAKTPFDDRVYTHASVKDLSFSLMREHLEKTKSKLYSESASMSVEELAEKMNLSQGAKEHLFPKNVGLLMFTNSPHKYFKGSQIELVEFPDGLAGKEFSEKSFEGSIQKQLVDVLDYLKRNVIKSKTFKYRDKEEVDKFYNYPYDAVEEALSNAVYHKNYELHEPIEVRVLPDKIEIISYNGADPSLKQSDFDKGVVRARRYRNRRIGEFLKELRLTEGRGTGIPTIIKALKDNGSPNSVFDANEPERTYFFVEIPIHPAFADQDTDQDTDQDKSVVNQDVVGLFQELEDVIKKEDSDVSDQDDDHDKKTFVLRSNTVKELVGQIEKVFVGTEIPDDKLISKYRDLAKEVTDEQLDVLKFALSPKSNKEIQEKALGLKTHSDNFKNYMQPLLNKGLIRRTIPSKPTSRHQKYYTTTRGNVVLFIREELKKRNNLS